MARSLVELDAVRYWHSSYHDVIGGGGAVGVRAQVLALVLGQALAPSDMPCSAARRCFAYCESLSAHDS